MTPEQEAQIIALCERIGMPWEKVPNRGEENPWNGRALNLAHSTKHGTSDFVHDVAHWLVAPTIMRQHADFGLDQMAVFFTAEEATLGDRDDVEEEQRASMLGMLLERSMGFDWRYTWEYHSWSIEGWSGVRDVVRQLQKLGHLRGLTPTCLLDATLGVHRR